MSKYHYLLIALLALALSWVLSSCHGSTQEARYRIAVTIAPTQALIEGMLSKELQRDSLEVKVLLPDGAVPESYEPTVETIAFLESCDAWYYVGDLGFEYQWIDKVKELNPNIKLVRLDEGLDHLYVEHSHGTEVHRVADPHYWFSLEGMGCMVDNTSKALQEVFGAEQVDTRRWEELMLSLQESLQNFHELPKAPVLVYHPALTYWAREVGSEQLVLEQDGKEPTPQHLAKLFGPWAKEAKSTNYPLGSSEGSPWSGSPKFVILREYKDISLSLVRSYGLQTLEVEQGKPYILDIFAYDVWSQLPLFYK